MRTLCPSRHQLQDFTLGQVPETFGLEVEEHLAHCPDCLATLDDLQPVDTLVEAVQVHEDSLLKLPSDHAIQEAIAQLKQLSPGPNNVVNRELALEQLWQMLPPAQVKGELARIGSYRILSVLGSGGMGIVLLGEDMQLQRRVAVKVLSPLLAAQESARKRFLREARATASLNHPNIISIHHVGEENGLPYFVMPYLEGESLEARLKREGRLPVSDIVRIGRELATGLAAAHGHGLSHRDVKPANIFLARTKQPETGDRRRASGVKTQSVGCDSQDLTHDAGALTPVLLDFGLSWVADDNERLTDHGAIIGTPPFMAPEQTRGEQADGRADLFALGSVLYVMCTGAAPFTGDSIYAVLEAVRTAVPRPIREVNPHIPAQLVEIVSRLHEKAPARRYQNAADVAQALARVPAPTSLEATSRVRHFPLRALVALVACLAIGIAGLLANSAIQQSAVSDPPAAVSGQQSAVSRQPAVIGDQKPAVGIPGSRVERTPAAVATDVEEPIEVAAAQVVKKEVRAANYFPAAMFPFEERGVTVKELGGKIVDLLYARMAVRPEIHLVDRADLKKVLAELELNLSGAVKESEAIRVGQLSGAKLMIIGSVFNVDKQIFVVARIVSTETGLVLAASVNGKSSDELAPLVEKLGDQLADKIKNDAHSIVAPAPSKTDRLAALTKSIPKGERPVVMVQVAERHVGAAPIDPAVQTEIMRFCKDTGFSVIDPELGLRARAEVLILGEALSETANRNGNLISVRARVELRAVDRATDKVLAADRQTALAVDLTEQIAGKSALEEAAAILAERMLPRLVKE